jgi:hypothetical protein
MTSYLPIKKLDGTIKNVVILGGDGESTGMSGGGSIDTTSLSNRINNKWDLNGNTGTTSSNFLGTIDNKPLRFKINNSPAGFINTTSTYNVALGIVSLPETSTGTKNQAFGGGALGLNTTGYNNSAVGYTTLYHNLSGHDNTANGWSSMGWDSAGIGNTSMGSQSMNQSGNTIHIGGKYNSAFGFSALSDNWNNNYNIGIGAFSGNASTENNTLYISDSTFHGYWKLDSAAGIAPSIIGKDANGYWHTYASPTSNTYTASNGLNIVGSDTIKLGGSLTSNTTITTSDLYKLTFSGSNGYPTPVIEVDNTADGFGIYATSIDGTAIKGISTSNTGIFGQSTDGYGISGQSVTQSGVSGFSTSGFGGSFYSQSSNNSVEDVLGVIGNANTTASSGLGAAILFTISRVGGGGSVDAGRVYYSEDASNNSTFGISTSTTGSPPTTKLTIDNLGIITLTQGLTNYTNNAAAISGGLTAGQLYRNGDVVQIVH